MFQNTEAVFDKTIDNAGPKESITLTKGIPKNKNQQKDSAQKEGKTKQPEDTTPEEKRNEIAVTDEGPNSKETGKQITSEGKGTKGAQQLDDSTSKTERIDEVVVVIPFVSWISRMHIHFSYASRYCVTVSQSSSTNWAHDCLTSVIENDVLASV